MYCALIGYIHYEAPVEEQNFATLIEFINAMEVREDDEEFQNPVDIMFENLEKKNPKHFAVRQYKKYKLHQNYLKRKASGAQKRYEDKIKERKKAEIEAKKAAIRAEDIAKGVFVPVSSLPQREPMKGVQTA